MRPGLHFNYTQRGIDFERLLWNDQISASGNAAVSAELPPMDKVRGHGSFNILCLPIPIAIGLELVQTTCSGQISHCIIMKRKPAIRARFLLNIPCSGE